jgi:hypothetical protein
MMPNLLTNPRLGNSGISSLLRSASTLSSSLSTYNDTVQRLTFENSAKTSADLQKYSDYLNGRITNLEGTGSVTNATKALDMRQTLISATHSSASADIQRSTIAVLDGQGTPDDKLAAIGNAFQRLYSIGDLSAAQAYEEQYYSYSQTVQLQKQQAADSLASAARGASSAYKSAVTAAEDTIKNNIQNANSAFAAQGPKFLDSQTNSYLKNNVDQTGAKINGSASIFAALAGQVGMVKGGIQLNNNTKYQQGTYTPGSMLDIYTQAIVADPTNATSYQSKIDSYLNGATGIALPGEGNKSITYNALMNTVYAGNSGNAPYGLVQGADGGWQVQAEHVTGYTFGKDQNGTTKLMPAYSFFNVPLDNKTGARDALVKAGINVKEDNNGDWWFQATTQASFLGRLFGNYPVQGAVQKNGSVEFMGSGGQLYQMVKGQNGLFGVQQLNQFGQVVNPNVAGQYGFKPPSDQTNVVGKGSTNFMSKVLGDSATPQITGNKIIYQANGKTYQLVTDTKGLKGLQEVDASGKVINANVAGQYGFNPVTLTRNRIDAAPDMKGTQFIQALFNQHNAYMQGLTNAKDPNYHNPEGISALTSPWLGVHALIDNAQMMQSINQVHNQTMIALANQAEQRRLAVLPVAPQPALSVAPAQPQPKLNVAQASPGSLGTQTVNPQPASTGTIQGGSFNLQGGNVSLQGGGIRLQ